MSALIAIAAQVGAPLVQKILRRRLGGASGELAADVLGQIATDMGTTPDRVEDVAQANPEAAREAVRKAEAAAPEIIELYAKGLEGQFNLAMAEVQGERFISWAWRPLGMWGLGALWFWNVIFLHVANAYWKIALPPMDLAILLQLTVVYCGLYMGGHTVKDYIDQRWGGK